MRVLTFTEEQKREIESQGMMVIEYKRIIYHYVKVMEIVSQRVDAAIQSLTEICEELADLIRESIDDFCEVVNSISKTFSSLESCKTFKTPRYPMVRQYSKCKTPDKNLIWKPRVKARSRLCSGRLR